MNVTAKRVQSADPDIQLTMPYEVAVTLLDLCRSVGGLSHGTYREQTYVVQKALCEAEIPIDNNGRFSGSIAAKRLK